MSRACTFCLDVGRHCPDCRAYLDAELRQTKVPPAPSHFEQLPVLPMPRTPLWPCRVKDDRTKVVAA